MESSPRVIGILVAFNTPAATVLETAARLSPQLSALLVMDNSDDGFGLAETLESLRSANVEHHSMHGNAGIAAAQNAGIARSIDLKADAVLFLDDDSTFPTDGVSTLWRELHEERLRDPRTAGIGPRIVDARTGQALIAVWEGSRVRPGHVETLVEAAYLVSSGALIPSSSFERFGTFRSEYFIDHVDQEWGFRVGLNGGRLVITSSVTMQHQLGDEPTVTRAGAVRYGHASPIRDYYLTRNAILLMRDLRFPPLRYIDLTRVLGESALRKILGPNRSLTQRRIVLRGLWDGLRNKRGQLLLKN